jgi:hypothetical protein
LPEPIESQRAIYGFGPAMLPYRPRREPAQICRDRTKWPNPFFSLPVFAQAKKGSA